MIAPLTNQLLRPVLSVEKSLTRLEAVMDQLEADAPSALTETARQPLLFRLSQLTTELGRLDTKLTDTRRLLDRLQRLATTLSRILTLLTTLPIPMPPGTPISLPVRIGQKATQVAGWIDGLKSVSKSGLALAADQEQRVAELRRRALALLRQLSYEPAQLAALGLAEVATGPTIAVPEPQTYQGYRLQVTEVDSAVPGARRWQALAYDAAGRLAYRSDASYTLQPAVLLETLRLQIDNGMA